MTGEQPVWLKEYHKAIKAEIHVETSLVEMIDSACEEFSEKIALSCMGTDMSYQEFYLRAEAFAAFLQNELGLKKGDRMAIMLPNLMQLPIAFYAALKIGVICVNTNPLYTPREMKHQFADSGAKVVVIVDLFLDKLEEIIKDTQIKHVVVTSLGDHMPRWKSKSLQLLLRVKRMLPRHGLKVISYRSALGKGKRLRIEQPELCLDDIAVLQYTGGTTGLAKAAMLSQSNIVANILQVQEWSKPISIRGGETILTALPLYHVFALSVNFLAFLTYGGQMILSPKPIPIKNLIKLFKRYNISVMTGVNTLFNALNNDPDFKKLAPRNLKVVIAGASALQKSVAKNFYNITHSYIFEGYGLTEASPVTHCNPMHKLPRSGSIGLPIPSTQAKILNEQQEVCKPLEVGELYVKGPQVMKGYWRREEETKQVLVGDGWLRTGDMAYMDEDGYFYIVDRKKDMILVSGFNVYPNEIEEVLGSHPLVLEVGAVGITDTKSGEAVKAYVVRKDESLTEEQLREFAKSQLTSYKCPKVYEFIDELPKSNIGKVLRRKLKSDDS